MPGEPAADDGREVDGKAPVPPATHGPPLRRGLHSPGVPSGLYVGTHNDNLSGDAPAIGFPTASPVLPGVTSQVTATLTPLFQGQLLGDPAQGSSHGRRCAGRGGGGTGVGGGWSWVTAQRPQAPQGARKPLRHITWRVRAEKVWRRASSLRPPHLGSLEEACAGHWLCWERGAAMRRRRGGAVTGAPVRRTSRCEGPRPGSYASCRAGFRRGFVTRPALQ